MEDCVGDSELANRSPRVCLNCKARKRKCDKALPACSRCDRLLLRCEYESPDSTTEDDVPLRLISSNFGSWTSWIRNFYISIQNRSLSLEDFVSMYFSTVHKWLPIINEKQFRDRVESRSYECDTNDFLLLTTLFLNVRRPDEQPHPAVMDDDLYQAVRHLYFHVFADMASSPSLQLLQSGLLLAIYEYGHGLVDAAHSTLFACLSASMSLGLHQTRAPLNMDAAWKSAMEDEFTLVWWGIVVTDRIICASSITKPRLPATIITDEANFLSDLGNTGNNNGDRLSWDQDSYVAVNFYRQVQSSVLLGHVLHLINDAPNLFSEESQSRFRVLDSQLQRAIQVTLQTETAGKLNSVSEALSLNRSAFLLLHRWQYAHSERTHNDITLWQSKMAIESIITITVETVRDFLPRIYAGWFKSHHPQGVQSVFLAAISLLHLGSSDNTSIEELKEMMAIQSRRWNIAAEYVHIVQNEQTQINS
ncbi:Photosystem I P700 chlorophyll a apoprotein A2 2 [Talaromyces islandicus]|uniref:Photosystem I P700 chlorophyll a apoprotein A2 2 n=1 Tax=Talaromyces islandicus TaxID=28573 RepID=A0A0U1LZT6_TALIS|nr:Photosystem I P700 chlorophyll a apoprotein A2 2 [Talaromyces islandicus]